MESKYNLSDMDILLIIEEYNILHSIQDNISEKNAMNHLKKYYKNLYKFIYYSNNVIDWEYLHNRYLIIKRKQKISKFI